MKLGTGSNMQQTQKYERVKVQNDLHTSKHTNKQTFPIFKCVTPVSKCLTRFARSPNIGSHFLFFGIQIL